MTYQEHYIDAMLKSDVPYIVIRRTILYMTRYPPYWIDLNAQYYPPDTDNKLTAGWTWVKTIADRIMNPYPPKEVFTC